MVISVPPPVPNGTTMRIGRLGHGAVCARPIAGKSTVAADSDSILRRVIFLSICFSRSRSSDVVLESVDGEILTGDEARLRRGKEQDELRDVVGPADPAQRDAVTRDFGAALDDDRVLRYLGLDKARTDRIDQDRRSELLCQGTCHAEYPRLGGSIGEAAHGGGHATGMRIHRRHRDDAAAALLQHDRRNRANIVEATLEVYRDRIVELAFRDLEHAL